MSHLSDHINMKIQHNVSSNKLLVPEMCKETIKLLESFAGPPNIEKAVGYLNPGGRTVFVLFDNGTSFSLKIDTSCEDGMSIENRKPLTESSMQVSRFNSIHLTKKMSYAIEEKYCRVLISTADLRHTYGYILREDKIGYSPLLKEFAVPGFCFFSDLFWNNKDLLIKLGLGARQDRLGVAQWLVENFSNGLYSFLEDALISTHLHFEVHQQNLTCRVRSGKIISFQYHDHLDCVWDPLSYVLDCVIKKQTAKITGEWICVLESSLFQAFGAVPSANQDNSRALVSVGSWWRRWIRSFGQYDRWINIYAYADPWRENNIEAAINQKLRQRFEKLNSESESALDDNLFLNIENIIHNQQQHKLRLVMNQLQWCKVHLDEALPALFSGEKNRSFAGVRSPLVREFFENWDQQNSDILYCEVVRGVFLYRITSHQQTYLYLAIRKGEDRGA